MRDVPAERLAYRFETDVNAPPVALAEEPPNLPSIQSDFETRRKDDALLRTVVSPDGQRALALYGTSDEPNEYFRIDLYSADGKFLRNLMPPDLSGLFPLAVAWSPDGDHIIFIARKTPQPQPTPGPPDAAPEEAPAGSPSPTASAAPVFAPVPVFNTEQIYICNRDGFDLKPLTTRDGLIYFYAKWAPDGHALASLACKEDEWEARAKDFKLPTGRLRLIDIDGRERLLDDGLTEALPAWSPDSMKVAVAFDTDVKIYDATASTPTQASIPLHDPLITASAAYDEDKIRKSKKATETINQTSGTAEPAPKPSTPPVSFNPIVRLEWPDDYTLYLKTAFIRTFTNDPKNNFQRWHVLHLSPQAALLSRHGLSSLRSLRSI